MKWTVKPTITNVSCQVHTGTDYNFDLKICGTEPTCTVKVMKSLTATFSITGGPT